MVHTKASVAPSITLFGVDLPTDKLGLNTEVTLYRSPQADFFMRITTTTEVVDPLAFLVSSRLNSRIHADRNASTLLVPSLQRGLIDMFKGVGAADYLLKLFPEKAEAGQVTFEVSWPWTSLPVVMRFLTALCCLGPQAAITPAFWGLKVSNNYKDVAASLNKLRKLVSWGPLALLNEFPATLDAVW